MTVLSWINSWLLPPIDCSHAVVDIEGTTTKDERSYRPLPAESYWHATDVGRILQKQGVEVCFYNLRNAENVDSRSDSFKDSPYSLQQWYEGTTAGLVSNVTDRLKTIETEPNHAKVINLSLGQENATILDCLLKAVKEKEGNTYKYPQLRAYLFGNENEQQHQHIDEILSKMEHDNSDHSSLQDKLQDKLNALHGEAVRHAQDTLSHFEKASLEPGGALNAALAEYTEITGKLKHDGTAIVVAAGNSGATNADQSWWAGRPASIENETNILTRGPNGSNPNVFVACASDKSENDFSTQKLADYSSRNDQCIVAPGTLHDGYDSKTGEKKAVYVTSLAAPAVAGFMNKMQRANPALSQNASGVEKMGTFFKKIKTMQ